MVSFNEHISLCILPTLPGTIAYMIHVQEFEIRGKRKEGDKSTLKTVNEMKL